MSVLDTLRTERAKYGTVMSEGECVNLLNSVAWAHRGERWGLSGKTFGNRASRYDGTELSVDVLQQRPEHPQYNWQGVMVDVLRSAGAESEPTWNVLGENTQTNRPWVAPIEHREPGGRVELTTKMGATLFSLVDLYQHERERGDRTLRVLRDELGAKFVRVFWRKGTGSSGDYWNNEPHRSLVRSNLQQLPPSLMREAMEWVGSYGMSIAHCVFADNLGMSLSDQDRFVDGFLQAESATRHVTEYVEVFNEPYTYGGGHGGDFETLRHHGRRLRAGLGRGVLLSLGTPMAVHAGGNIEQEVADMYGDYPDADLITVHFSRATNNPQRAPELSHFAPRKRSNGEPIGPDSSVAQTKDPQALAANFRETTRAGYEWYVFHANQLIRPRGTNIWELAEWSAIADALRPLAGGGNGGGGGGTVVQPGADKLIPGQSLLPGQRLRSPAGLCYLEFQHDGNAVIYQDGVGPVWASQSSGIPPGRLEMQADGHLVLYDADGTPRRATGTSGHPGASVQLQDDANLVMYHEGQPIWASASSDLYDEQGEAVAK